MSATTFVEYPEIKERLRQDFYMPKLMGKREIIAPLISRSPARMGIGFDYLLRFYIQKINPNAISREWIAETWLENRQANQGKSTEGMLKTMVDAEKIIKKAKKLLKSYLTSRNYQIGKSLINTAVSLTYIDEMLRAPVLYIGGLPKVARKKDIKDLNNLIKAINPHIFKAKEICLLNPTFGETGIMVGGADADLVIDDMLIDIKTTKHFNLNRRDFNQLLGYYFLHRLDGIGQVRPKIKITKLGIYFSRFAYLHVMDLKDIASKKVFEDFTKFFKNKAIETKEKRERIHKELNKGKEELQKIVDRIAKQPI